MDRKLSMRVKHAGFDVEFKGEKEVELVTFLLEERNFFLKVIDKLTEKKGTKG